jgi:hypothetical protein
MRCGRTEMNLQTVSLTVTFDLEELNNQLGNTPNVTAKDAVKEMLDFKRRVRCGLEDALVPLLNVWEVSTHTSSED